MLPGRVGLFCRCDNVVDQAANLAMIIGIPFEAGPLVSKL